MENIHPSSYKNIHRTSYIFSDCKVGKNCRIGAYAIIGSLGLLCKRGEDNKLTRVKSEGSVILEDNVDIGAGSYIQRGKIGNKLFGKYSQSLDLLGSNR